MRNGKDTLGMLTRPNVEDHEGHVQVCGSQQGSSPAGSRVFEGVHLYE